MRRNLVPCLSHGPPGAPGPTAVLNVEGGFTQGLGPVRMERCVQDAPRYYTDTNLCAEAIIQVLQDCFCALHLSGV